MTDMNFDNVNNNDVDTSTIEMTHERLRAFQTRTASINGPQWDALQWAAQRQYCANRRLVTSYMVMAQELGVSHKPNTWRAYTAIELTHLVDTTCVAQKTQQCWCEIVIRETPCKTYLDLELAPNTKQHNGDKDIAMRALCEQFNASTPIDLWKKCDVACEKFVSILMELLAKRANRGDLSVALDVERLEAHKSSKWSIHVIIDGSRIGRGVKVCESVLWRTNADCKAFILDVLDDERVRDDDLIQEIVDKCVYSANRLIRIYGSSKLKEPKRVLQPPNRSYDMAVDQNMFIRSLITCVCVRRDRFDAETRFFLQPSHASLPGDSEYVCVSSQLLSLVELESLPLLECTYASLVRKSKRLLTNHSVSSGLSLQRTAISQTIVTDRSPLLHRICAHEEFSQYQPGLRIKGDRPEKLLLPATSSKCEHAPGGVHSHGKQPAFLLLDLLRARYQQRCLSTSCNQTKAIYHVMPRNLASLCMQYLRKEWPSGEVIGTGSLRRCLPRVTRATIDAYDSDDNIDRIDIVSKEI